MNVFIVIVFNELKIPRHTKLLSVLASNLKLYFCFRTRCLEHTVLTVLKDICQNPSAEDPQSSELRFSVPVVLADQMRNMHPKLPFSLFFSFLWLLFFPQRLCGAQKL